MAAASSSTKPSEHWTAAYRLRLGIGDSPVEFFSNPWKAPKAGEFKILFKASTDDSAADSVGSFIAVAFSSSVSFFGFTRGKMKYRRKMGMELYALRAAAKLSKALKLEGIHTGPVVFETISSPVLSACFDEGMPETVLKQFMPDDLEDVDHNCEVYIGQQEEMVSLCAHFHPGIKAQLA